MRNRKYVTIEERILKQLNKKYGEKWYVYVLSVGNRRIVGKYYQYKYQYLMYPKKGWVGGYDDGIFKILKK